MFDPRRDEVKIVVIGESFSWESFQWNFLLTTGIQKGGRFNPVHMA